ncbi:mitochondrial import receptor subunit TOM34 isoform X2 [Sceloporus undulatus]|uniref:mitochondrial import receptor subunit TOM34 isoform X2 n=1 Tax=Sceloporus undulatus TaxID=8520 RepID=UPI001C4BFD9D|nr:mitochondrial import receptor subunit TOM34 isoform X2 [Sceloporus undulatus]
MAPASQASSLKEAGNQQFRNGQYSQAAALYGRALELLEAAGDANAEEKSVLYSNRAACYLKDGNCSLCIKDCSDALELVPFAFKPLLRRAAAYEALERMTKALLDKDGLQWRQKLPPIPTVPVSAQKKWEPPPAGNKVNDTAPVTNQVPTAATTKQANALKLEGNEFVKKGNYKKAVEKYTQSLKLHKLECATYTNRALCYLNLKQYKEAIQDCSEALQIDPKNVKAFYRRAQAYKELKNYKSSKADIASLLKIEPENSAAKKLLQELNKLLK